MIRTEGMPILLEPVANFSADVAHISDRIAAKAYEYFVERGCVHGHDVDDWVRAEQELVLKPAAEFHREDSALVVDIDLPDSDPAHLQVRLTSREMLVIAVTGDHRQIFRIIQLPERIDCAGAGARFFDNKLQVIAPVLSEEASQQPQVRGEAVVA